MRGGYAGPERVRGGCAGRLCGLRGRVRGVSAGCECEGWRAGVLMLCVEGVQTTVLCKEGVCGPRLCEGRCIRDGVLVGDGESKGH